MDKQIQIDILDNGLRLVQRKNSSEIVHVGLMLDAGSRDENELNNGVAHFIEHTVFKGTRKRKARELLTMIEKVGGEINAYTTREKTLFYVSCLKQYAERAFDMLSDLVYGPTFPEKENEKEKSVILEEIEMYEDSPDESIYDDFYIHHFKGHSLGYNILGTRETVQTMNLNMIQEFRQLNHTLGNAVLSIVGNIEFDQSLKLANKYFSDITTESFTAHRKKPESPSRFEVNIKKDFSQTHCMMGSEAYSRHDERRFGLSVINNILGGAGMSARLSMAVREKHALTYHISSGYSSYQDSAVFSIYFATEKKKLEKCRKLILKELDILKDKKISLAQLQLAKTQILGQVALLEENQNVFMQSQAKSLLDYGRVITFSDFLDSINRVTAEDILDISNDIFAEEKISTLIYESE